MADANPAAQPSGSAQRMFGPQAGVYATSRVHVRDDSLDILQRMAGDLDHSGSNWALDLGISAGFTAFAMAEFTQRVVATDPTRPMLEQARRIGRERELDNVQVSRNSAEYLPFADGSIDMVTSRVAGHHFANLDKALDEVRRTLKEGGVFLMADSVCPEEDDIDRWMNDIELRRDFSHVRNRKVSEIRKMLSDRGLKVLQQDMTRVYLKFNEWVARTATPEAEAAALRRDFLEASDGVREAFQIEPADGE